MARISSINRRALVAFVLATLGSPRRLLAQPSTRVYRIATLDDSIESIRTDSWRVFRQRLSELGIVEGRDVAYDSRYANGDTERLPALAAELVAFKPDILICPTTAVALVGMRATSSIPIIFIGSGDPVSAGLVRSFSNPGGNVTGISNVATALSGKLVELLLEMSPHIRNIAYLCDASNKGNLVSFREIVARARPLGVNVRMLDGRKQAKLEDSLETIKRERLQGIIVAATAILLMHRDRIVQFAAQEKLPVVYGRRDYVDAGGLLSYSADVPSLFRRGAEYARKILGGAKPSDLPVYQSSSFHMVVNLTAANALSMKIPQSVRLRADELIN